MPTAEAAWSVSGRAKKSGPKAEETALLPAWFGLVSVIYYWTA